MEALKICYDIRRGRGLQTETNWGPLYSAIYSFPQSQNNLGFLLLHNVEERVSSPLLSRFASCGSI